MSSINNYPNRANYPLPYPLINRKEPELYREIYPYTSVCRTPIEEKSCAPAPAKKFHISDTTFRDGQQARAPYTIRQIETLFDFLHRLSGPRGLISHTDFFIYSERDRAALEACRKKGYEFPRITSWIRANQEDFKLAKDMEIDETGILASVSDYHIYLKMGLDRKEAFDKYYKIALSCIEEGITPRLHLEDITRADMYGFVLPLVQKLVDLMAESKKQIKLRLCDTLGFGVSYPNAALPRSVPKIIRTLIEEGGISGDNLEWHGHNDFHRAFSNSTTAWMYGCATLNATLLGFGERTGIAPVEALLTEYVSLTGDDEGVDLRVITEMADFFREIGFDIPIAYPLVGEGFNATSAGIHLDGLSKNEEIYNIFDTKKILNRPIEISINDKSGCAGLAIWINSHFALSKDTAISKRDQGVIDMHRAISQEYEKGRITVMTNEELSLLARSFLPELFV